MPFVLCVAGVYFCQAVCEETGRVQSGHLESAEPSDHLCSHSGQRI